MIEVFGALFGIGFFGLLTQRSLVSVLLNLQVMVTSLVLVLVVSSQTFSPVSRERAGHAALAILLVFGIQVAAALAYATRLHYLRRRSGMDDLKSMRH